MPASLRLGLPLEVYMSATWISLYTFVKHWSHSGISENCVNPCKYSGYIMVLMDVTEKVPEV